MREKLNDVVPCITLALPSRNVLHNELNIKFRTHRSRISLRVLAFPRGKSFSRRVRTSLSISRSVSLPRIFQRGFTRTQGLLLNAGQVSAIKSNLLAKWKLRDPQSEPRYRVNRTALSRRDAINWRRRKENLEVQFW